MKKIFTIFFISGLLLSGAAETLIAQDGSRGNVRAVSDDISIRLGGTIQPRLTYTTDDEDRIGYGLRRLRFRLYTDIGDNLGVFLQMEGSGSAATWLDIRGEYRVHNHLTIRTGRFVGAQPRAYARTLHSAIDAIDRPAISDKWARKTIGADGRDYGVEALWNSPRWELRGFLHNGYNQSNFRRGISNDPVAGGVKTDGFAFSAAGTYFPGARDAFQAGLYASVNTAQNPLTVVTHPDVNQQFARNYISYSAHAYYGALPGDQPYRVKADLIGISYQDVKPEGHDAMGVHNYLGGSLFGALLASPCVELFAMGELWYGDMGNADQIIRTYGTVGGSYSLSARAGRPFALNRIILTYSLRTKESKSIDFEDPAHVFMMQTQFYF